MRGGGDSEPLISKGCESRNSGLRKKFFAFTLAEGATHVDNYNNIRRAAFTLAEVLITLGVIGVVAALTIPTLMSNYKKTEFSSRLKKFNSVMSQAIVMSENDNGPIEDWMSPGPNNLDLVKWFETYLKPYLKNINYGYDGATNSNTALMVYLADGSYFRMVKGNCMDLFFDVNGDKPPNAHGRDWFRFLICSNSSEWCNGRHFCGMGSTNNVTREQKLEGCKNGDRGSECTGLLEYDGWVFKDDYPFRL